MQRPKASSPSSSAVLGLPRGKLTGGDVEIGVGPTEKANRKGINCIYARSIVRELNQKEDLSDIIHR